MRMYAYLKEPLLVNKNDHIYKIMVHEMKREAFVYQYTSRDAIQCSFDSWYPDKDSAIEDWQELIDETGWVMLDDPLPDCQHDAFLPIRIKRSDKNAPQWEGLETRQV